MLSGRRVVAAGTAVLAVLYLVEALDYPRGSVAQPGPGLYPLLVGVTALLSSLGVLLAEHGRQPEGVPNWPDGVGGRRILAVGAGTVGYVALLPLIGHPAAATVLTLLILHAMGLRGWLAKLTLSVTIGVGSYLLFAVLLGVPLPVGLWAR